MFWAHSLSFFIILCVILGKLMGYEVRRILCLCKKKIEWILVEGCVICFLLCFPFIS
jgi:hypothetical protein